MNKVLSTIRWVYSKKGQGHRVSQAWKLIQLGSIVIWLEEKP